MGTYGGNYGVHFDVGNLDSISTLNHNDDDTRPTLESLHDQFREKMGDKVSETMPDIIEHVWNIVQSICSQLMELPSYFVFNFFKNQVVVSIKSNKKY